MSVDLFYETAGHRTGEASAARSDSTDALAVEMEAAALFAVGARAGDAGRAACSRSPTPSTRDGARTRIDEHALLAAAEAWAAAAIAALSA